jgi:transposase-like protein
MELQTQTSGSPLDSGPPDSSPLSERPELGQGAAGPAMAGSPLPERGRSPHSARTDGPPAEAPSVRGRPGRRTIDERRDAVLALLSGKASADQLAKRYGVLASTVEGWREESLAGITEALKRGTGKSARELELEKENAHLREALADTTVQLSLVQRAIGVTGSRPTVPARSRR